MASIKSLAVLLDKYLSWKEYTGYTENKAAKSIGLMYRSKQF